MVLGTALLAGVLCLWRRRWVRVLAVSGTFALPVSVAALISFIALYFYELPTHHCPFCLLQREYGYVGYAVYATLLLGGIAAGGSWVLIPHAGVASLRRELPRIHRRLAAAAVAAYGLFAAIVGLRIAFSELSLVGY
jgi:hypothetical protein